MTDKKHDTKEVGEPSKRKKVFDAVTGINTLPPGKTKRTFYIITGISDLYIIGNTFKKTFSLLTERASFLNRQIKTIRQEGRETTSDEPSYAAVMANSKRSEDELLISAGHIKKYWLICLVMSGLAGLFILTGALRLMLSPAGTGGLHLFLTFFLTMAVAALAVSKAIYYDFLGWRIRNRCNSEAEQGTYRFYLLDGGRSHAFRFGQAGKQRGMYADN